MKTLVIHPKDITTDFLSVIYAGTDWTIISDPTVSSKVLKNSIKSHDRIVMLGHGTEQGMGDMIKGRYLISPSLVYLLREKIGVYIWCNADIFVKKYNLKGFYTGMIVSEYEEALMYCIYLREDDNSINKSNTMFAESVKNSIDSDNMLESMSSYNDDDNEVILFNKQNLYYV